MSITWGSTGGRGLSNEALPRKCATRWVREFRAPSQRNGLDWILTTKDSGSSALSVQGTFVRGPLAFRPGGARRVALAGRGIRARVARALIIKAKYAAGVVRVVLQLIDV